MSGHAALEAFIAGVEALRSMNEAVAKSAEQPVADAVREGVSKGESPSGEAWAPLKGGGRPLDGAAGAITSSVKGTQIRLTIGKPYVFHNWGTGRSPKRQILPHGGEPIPATVNAAIKATAERVFRKAVG